ncbi:LytR/AlgR family response regulator transcription factor [Alkalitalea saponilacus]|uniref:Two component transcriptional regulator, LytTR family n=1 Tax=Alkalitalea saponilacus TaxID=889453 RepID=A0A1T5FLH5_9BACT|nr:LytTR family DNA-binding domain-containing protein [Alkalitalea saponilacus]ASB49435.1 DNA-binding response regulator [Alkalitalea saponilacus]SKB97051.1 two component transcriptional regulator, LytTR family [Alkalitalea saponilacus]
MEKILKTVIIDDEEPARQRLKELLAVYPNHFDIIGEAENGKKGLEIIHRLNPDLLFLDIQMPGMNGFELIKQLDNIPIIVFCSAFDHYSLDAFETNSLDYLLKPVSSERFSKTVDKLMRFTTKVDHKGLMDLIKKFEEQIKQPEITSITIKKGNKLLFVKLEDISYFKAEDKYVKIQTVQGKDHITEKPLKELAEKLPNSFIRIHRSIIVNKKSVRELQNYFNCKYVFIMNDKLRTKLYSGRSFQTQIKKWVDLS